MVKHLQAIRRQEPTNYLSMFDHFETGLQYLGMSVAMLRGGLGGCRVVAAVLGQRGKFLSFVAAGAIRLGALSMGSRGAYLRPHRAFSGFFGTIAAIFILVGGLGTGLSFCGLDTFLIFPNFLRS